MQRILKSLLGTTVYLLYGAVFIGIGLIVAYLVVDHFPTAENTALEAVGWWFMAIVLAIACLNASFNTPPNAMLAWTALGFYFGLALHAFLARVAGAPGVWLVLAAIAVLWQVGHLVSYTDWKRVFQNLRWLEAKAAKEEAEREAWVATSYAAHPA